MSGGSEELVKKALDGGVLIALAVDDPAARKLKEEISRGRNPSVLFRTDRGGDGIHSL